MKKGDFIYVNFPTGRGGPYQIEGIDLLDDFHGFPIIKVGGKERWVDPAWCEPAKPKPEHRGWDELSSEDKDWFFRILEDWEYDHLWASDVYEKAYELITGKDHPEGKG